jgi:TolB-like protein/Tfp pilus assembly protein PilF
MGEVYRAHDPRLRRDIAVKVLPRELAGDPERRSKLLREARAAAALNHPSICTIHEVDEADGEIYIAMELVEGQALIRVLARGPLSPREVVRYGLQISDALAHAHDRGVSHRDLKSANVIITPDGRAKVVDFGLASRLKREAVDETTMPTALEAGAVAGTLPYMAPEQLRGDPGDMRSDVWALGVVLYEMATGTRPFQGHTVFEVSSAILTQTTTPPPHVPPALRAVIMHSLEKDPGRRYQRAGEVRAALETTDAGSAWVSGRRQAADWYRPSRAIMMAAALALVAAFVALQCPGLRRVLRAGGAPAPIQSLAVLPLDNLSRDPAQQFFADGLTEALTVDLAKISSIRVPSRTSVMRYKGTTKTLPEIARELAVDAFVEGSAQLDGQRVRVTAQLIRAQTDQHLWADSYERDLRDILTMQSELAQDISTAIQAKLTTQDQVRLAKTRPVDPDAHLAYLQGRYQLNRRAEGNVEKARGFFQQAIDKDPSYTAGYVGLADSYYLLFDYPKMKMAAARALELDEGLADAHASIGLVRTYYDWDWSGAERELKRAIELNPASATARHYYAHYLMAMRRIDESLVESKRALDLDPLNPLMTEHLAFHYHYARQYDQALEQLRRLVEMEPALALGHLRFGLTFEQKGMFNEASEAFQRAIRLSNGGLAVPDLGHLYAVSRQRSEALKTLENLRSQHTPPAYGLALLYAGLGDKDLAFQWLERAHDERSAFNLMTLAVEPRLDPLREDRRFQDLLRRMNFPP